MIKRKYNLIVYGISRNSTDALLMNSLGLQPDLLIEIDYKTEYVMNQTNFYFNLAQKIVGDEDEKNTSSKYQEIDWSSLRSTLESEIESKCGELIENKQNCVESAKQAGLRCFRCTKYNQKCSLKQTIKELLPRKSQNCRFINFSDAIHLLNIGYCNFSSFGLRDPIDVSSSILYFQLIE